MREIYIQKQSDLSLILDSLLATLKTARANEKRALRAANKAGRNADFSGRDHQWKLMAEYRKQARALNDLLARML